MRLSAILPGLLAAGALASTAPAQTPSIVRVGPGLGGRGIMINGGSRAAIGLSTSSAATSRDTLGVLVSSVRSDSPAEKAGITEGNRIASINGVSLKLSASDVGDEEMADVMTRRLSRELDRMKPGDDVDLRVVADGQTKSVKVKTVSTDDLYQSPARRAALERPTLGLRLAVTGNARDTIGVFVLSVDDAGPAAKAGIIEGSRIASINGIDVRGHAPDPDDDFYVTRAGGSNRLEREISRLKAGDDVDLRVYYNGQYRSVKTKLVRAGDLPRRNSAIMITGDAMISPDFDVTALRADDEVRRALETARVATGSAMTGITRGLGAAFGGIGGRTLVW